MPLVQLAFFLIPFGARAKTCWQNDRNRKFNAYIGRPKWERAPFPFFFLFSFFFAGSMGSIQKKSGEGERKEIKTLRMTTFANRRKEGRGRPADWQAERGKGLFFFRFFSFFLSLPLSFSIFFLSFFLSLATYLAHTHLELVGPFRSHHSNNARKLGGRAAAAAAATIWIKKKWNKLERSWKERSSRKQASISLAS